MFELPSSNSELDVSEMWCPAPEVATHASDLEVDVFEAVELAVGLGDQGVDAGLAAVQEVDHGEDERGQQEQLQHRADPAAVHAVRLVHHPDASQLNLICHRMGSRG